MIGNDLSLNQGKIVIILVVVLILLSAAGVSLYLGYTTVTTSGDAAIAVMTGEELEALELINRIKATTSKDEANDILGEPSEDVYVVSKWNGFGGSSLSQMRIYFDSGYPRKIRWIKLGNFIYEIDFGEITIERK